MNSENERHREKMAKIKTARDKMLATKTGEKGLLIVHTGPGKGKSSAAFGMGLRALGHGMKLGIIQFIKGAWETGEQKAFARFGDQVTFLPLGEGFTWETQDKARDMAAARKAWETAKKMMADESFHMVILDELNIVLRYDYLDRGEVLETLKNRRSDLHVIVTGRSAHEDMIAAADLVTEMSLVKHPFRAGIKAQPGIEF